MKRYIAAAAALLALSMPGIGLAWAQENHGDHGHGHDQLHHWYKSLTQSPDGASCCSDADCRPTRIRARDDAIEVMVDGEWTVVPPSKILRVTPPDLNTHVCAPKGPWKTKPIYCVVLGFGA